MLEDQQLAGKQVNLEEHLIGDSMDVSMVDFDGSVEKAIRERQRLPVQMASRILCAFKRRYAPEVAIFALFDRVVLLIIVGCHFVVF